MKITFCITVFITIIILPAYAGIFVHGLHDDLVLETDNRMAARLTVPPVLSVRAIGKFRKNIDHVINDRLLKKDAIVRMFGSILSDPVMFSSMDTSKGVIGKHGFVFVGDRTNNPIDRHCGRLPSDRKHDAMLLEQHVILRNAARNVGADYVILVAPDKHAVYCEEFPDWLRANQCGRTNSITSGRLAMLAENSFSVLHPLEQLRKTARTERIYYKTDTHWNMRGAETAFYLLMEHAARHGKLLGGRPFERHAGYRLVASRATGFGDLGTRLNLPDSFPLDDITYDLKMEQEHVIQWKKDEHSGFENEHLEDVRSQQHARYERMINRSAKYDRKILILHDSFNELMSPFWNMHFTEITYCYKKGRPMDDYVRIIEEFRPDLVVYETVEREF